MRKTTTLPAIIAMKPSTRSNRFKESRKTVALSNDFNTLRRTKGATLGDNSTVVARNSSPPNCSSLGSEDGTIGVLTMKRAMSDAQDPQCIGISWWSEINGLKKDFVKTSSPVPPKARLIRPHRILQQVLRSSARNSRGSCMDRQYLSSRVGKDKQVAWRKTPNV